MKLEHYPQETARYDRRDEKPGSMAKVLDRISKAAYGDAVLSVRIGASAMKC